MSGADWRPPDQRRPNPWAGATITKLSVVRSGSPICFYDVRFPLLELTLIGGALWRTKSGRLWASAPKQKRLTAAGPTQYDDIITWDGGGPASMFSAACIAAIEKHSPQLLTPLLEGEGRDVSGARLLGAERDR